MKSLNFSYNKGRLSISLRQCIIACIDLLENLCSQQCSQQKRHKWQTTLWNIWKLTLEKDYTVLQDKWLTIYQLGHKTIHDNEFMWFQCRILYKILEDYLQIICKSQNFWFWGVWTIRNQEYGSIDHLCSKNIIEINIYRCTCWHAILLSYFTHILVVN